MLETKKCPKCYARGYWEDENQTYDEYKSRFPEECDVCKDQHYVPVQEDEIVFVNVYEVTRHYGGPEEGGWWYNWYKCLETFPVQNRNAETLEDALYAKYEYLKHGDIYSVLGGTDIVVYTEGNPAEYETKERPYYC